MKPGDLKRLIRLMEKYPKLFVGTNNAGEQERNTDEFYINGNSQLSLAITNEADFADLITLTHEYVREDLMA